MAGADRMTIEEVVKNVLLDEHADVIREAVKAVAAEMMELEVSELIGAELGERRPDDASQRLGGSSDPQLTSPARVTQPLRRKPDDQRRRGGRNEVPSDVDAEDLAPPALVHAVSDH